MSTDRLHRLFGGLPEEYLPTEHRYVKARDHQLLSVAKVMASEIQSAIGADVDPNFLFAILDASELGLVADA